MNRAHLEYSQKRNYIRMKVDAPIDVTIESQNTSIKGVCRNISGGGMLITIDRELPVGAELTVMLVSLHGHNPRLKAKTVVVRVEADPSGNYTLGVKIKQMLS